MNSCRCVRYDQFSLSSFYDERYVCVQCDNCNNDKYVDTLQEAIEWADSHECS